MLPLNDPRWSELNHAYGAADDMPGLLIELEGLPPEEGTEAEPYLSLWSSLCHQGDIYTASFAVVPHIVRIIRSAPERVPWTLFQLVACIEIARRNGRKAPEIPSWLSDAYFTALTQIPDAVAGAARADWDNWYCGAALAAIAAAKGFCSLAEAILELDPDTIRELMRSKFDDEPQ